MRRWKSFVWCECELYQHEWFPQLHLQERIHWGWKIVPRYIGIALAFNNLYLCHGNYSGSHVKLLFPMQICANAWILGHSLFLSEVPANVNHDGNYAKHTIVTEEFVLFVPNMLFPFNFFHFLFIYHLYMTCVYRYRWMQRWKQYLWREYELYQLYWLL